MKKDVITIDEFVKVDIRVGLVTKAQAVPDSKKLIQLTVDMGEDYGIVTILTGLLQYYPDPTVLTGKKYLILANLAPRTMANIPSQGMFMAIDSADKPMPVVVPDDTPLGTLLH